MHVFLEVRRVKGKRGCGRYCTTIIFGGYKRNGKVYTEIVETVPKQPYKLLLKGK